MELDLHPMLVHFPVALFSSALILETLSIIFKKESLHRSAVHLFVLAVFAAPFTVWTGLREAQEEHLVKHPVLDLHKTFALVTMWLGIAAVLALLFVRKRAAGLSRIVFLVFLVALVSMVAIAAYNGGRLVYEYGIGVEKE